MRSMFLSANWGSAHLKHVKNVAGVRYTPKLNVQLPISQIFEGISRSSSFYLEIRTHFGKLQRTFLGISSKYSNNQLQEAYQKFSKTALTLTKKLSSIKKYNSNLIPWGEINELTGKVLDESWQFSKLLHEEKDKVKPAPGTQSGQISPSERLSFDLHELSQFQSELRYFQDFSSSTSAQLSDNPFLALTGPAGTGKTHLLCDVVEKRANFGQPFVFLFGELFSGDEFWSQIAKSLYLHRDSSKHEILSRLNLIGNKKKTRSLIIIDALNETLVPNYWKTTMESIVREISKYPHVALIVSIRSGFEGDVLHKNVASKFIIKEHQGFQFREWEAVTTFFKEFSLPLPEIPLLMPEFQNPLFLLLFCKAFKNRSATRKQIFRGHEGANYIFENFVKSMADIIAKQLKLRPGRTNGNYVIWDTVIERVADEMVSQGRDRITEEGFIKILSAAHPETDSVKLAGAIERNFLMVKVPRYSQTLNQTEGFDYRFPFQKFSDHLIARYIFKHYRASGKTPACYFEKDSPMGDFVARKQGIVEALSIEFPEMCKGLEFFEVAPHISEWILEDAVIESIIWRKPTAFSGSPQKIIGFIRQHSENNDTLLRKFLNACISVAAVPNHAFNAHYLHSLLVRNPMPKRDSFWSSFLHYQHGEHNAVDRLIEWGWSFQSKAQISNESIKLCSVALTWFLTAPNRALRDKATKALVCLLTSRLNTIMELFDYFKKVDDPYLRERLYAVGYGALLRNSDDLNGMKTLADWCLVNIFRTKQVPTHVLMRDYLIGIVDVAIRRGACNSSERRWITPPFGAKWPWRVPAAETLKAKYYPHSFFEKKTKDRGCLSIWSSVMHDFGTMGDFGNYEVNSELRRWSGRLLKGQNACREEMYKEFKGNLSNTQLDLLDRINPTFKGNMRRFLKKLASDEGVSKLGEDEVKRIKAQDKKLKKEALRRLLGTLSPHKRQLLVKEILPYLDGRGGVIDPLDQFPTGLAQRWIFNRTMDLGWSPKLHGDFDDNVNMGRYERIGRKPERIGKKYQWIALHELLAIAADNFEFKGDSVFGKSEKFAGAWQLGIRDIDPSCVLRDRPEEPTPGIPIIRSLKPKFSVRKGQRYITTWIKDLNGLPSPESIIELKDANGNSWLVLDGFFEWLEELPPEHEKYDLPTKKLYYSFRSYLINKKDNRAVLAWAKKQDSFHDGMPQSNQFYHVYLGEYPDLSAFLYQNIPYYHHSGWSNQATFAKLPARVLVTDDEYVSSGSSVDCSTEEAVKVKLPAKWIINRMRLVQKNVDGRFYNKAGELIAFDPQVFAKKAPAVILMRKDKLCDFLKRQKLSILWTFNGEKQTIGGGAIGQPYGWQQLIGVYALNDSKRVAGLRKSKYNAPTPQR